MNFRAIRLFIFILVAIAISGCGNALSSILGPVLDISEMKSLSIGQFYSATGLEDEYAPTGEFAIYLRDAATGRDMACAGQDNGMDTLGRTQTFYAGLDIPLQEVQGDRPKGSARVQVVFVEKDGEDCPHPITSGDDIVGISDEFSSEDLLNNLIWSSNGLAAVEFRLKGTDADNPAPMAFAMEDGLVVDQIGIFNGSDGDEQHLYYLFAERYEGGDVVEVCQTGDEELSNIRFGNMTYAALNLPVPCITSEIPNFDMVEVKLSLWIQKSDGPEMVGETDVEMIGDIIGEHVEFTNGKGYIRFRNVATEPFSSRYARLEELSNIELTSLEFPISPAATETIEVHFRSPDGYSVACTGPDQGLIGVEDPHTPYDNLSAWFVPIDGQVELFGWNYLDLMVVGRSDGKSCPDPLEGADDFSILADINDLEPLDLSSGEVGFQQGGQATWVYVPITN